MALTTCPFCHGTISESAVECPNCGCPISPDNHSGVSDNTGDSGIVETSGKPGVLTITWPGAFLLSKIHVLVNGREVGTYPLRNSFSIDVPISTPDIEIIIKSTLISERRKFYNLVPNEDYTCRLTYNRFISSFTIEDLIAKSGSAINSRVAVTDRNAHKPMVPVSPVTSAPPVGIDKSHPVKKNNNSDKKSSSVSFGVILLIIVIVCLSIAGVAFYLYTNNKDDYSIIEKVTSTDYAMSDEEIEEPYVSTEYLENMDRENMANFEAAQQGYPDNEESDDSNDVKSILNKMKGFDYNSRECLFFEGSFSYNDVDYPIMLCLSRDGDIWDSAIYHNVNQGTNIRMKIEYDTDHVYFVGKDGKNDFIITVQPRYDGAWIGNAVDGEICMETVIRQRTAETIPFKP